MPTRQNFDLEPRLIDFSVLIISISNAMPTNKVARHLSGQLVMSGTSVALNYGEAESAESRKDFIHKVKIILKELRKTLICLKIIHRTSNFKSEDLITKAIQECNELIAIFIKSTETAKKNMISEENHD